MDRFKKIFNIEDRTKYFPYVLACFFVVSVLIFSLLLIGEISLSKKGQVAKIKSPFAEVSLEAKGAVVWDVVGKKELFSKNSDMPLPLASLTKVMTAVTTDGKLNDSQEIKITKDDLAPEGDSGLLVGDVWKARDLRDFTLITSSNDGAIALAMAAEAQVVANPPYNPNGMDATSTQEEFIKAMNYTASQIGLKNSKFFNEHGLDMNAGTTEVVIGGAYGSAKDMATLFEYALRNYPQILEATRYKNLQFESADKKYSAENTNVIIDKIPNIIASKTGYTDLAGGNLVVAFDAGLNRPIIISVLGSTEQGRFTDVQKLVDASLKYIQTN